MFHINLEEIIINKIIGIKNKANNFLFLYRCNIIGKPFLELILIIYIF